MQRITQLCSKCPTMNQLTEPNKIAKTIKVRIQICSSKVWLMFYQKYLLTKSRFQNQIKKSNAE